jgi:hypothetical protein
MMICDESATLPHMYVGEKGENGQFLFFLTICNNNSAIIIS